MKKSHAKSIASIFALFIIAALMLSMIINDGEKVFKVCRGAKSVAALKKEYGGNGEFVRVKDVTEAFPISEEHLRVALRGWGEEERELIVGLLRNNYENVITY